MNKIISFFVINQEHVGKYKITITKNLHFLYY